jgi:hypothetical protein
VFHAFKGLNNVTLALAKNKYGKVVLAEKKSDLYAGALICTSGILMGKLNQSREFRSDSAVFNW